MKGRPWTFTENERLVELAAKRLKAREIGKLMGRSEYAIQQHANRLGIELHNTGWSSRKSRPPASQQPRWTGVYPVDEAAIYRGRRYDEVRA